MKKRKRRYYQYLPKHFLRGGILFVLIVYLFMLVKYLDFYRFIEYAESYTQSSARVTLYGMLSQTTVEEQKADLLEQLYQLTYKHGPWNLAGNPALRKNGYSAILDRATGEIVLESSQEDAIIFLYGVQESFNNPTYFVARRKMRPMLLLGSKEALAPIYEKYYDYKKDMEEGKNDHGGFSASFCCYPEDFYIKGDEFVPGKVLVREQISFQRPDEEILRETVMDLTPADPSGYEHYICSEIKQEEEISFSIYYDETDRWVGNEDDGFDSEKERAIALEMYADKWMNSVLSPDLIRLLTGVKKDIVSYNAGPLRDIEGHEYVFINYSHYKYQIWRDEEFYYAVLPIAALMCLAIFVMAFVDWQRNRYRLMTKEFRRTLMNSMAHDLKSPLMAIGGFAENLLANVHGEKKEYYAREILNCVGSMDEIIRRNLELLGYEEKGKKTRLNRTKVDVPALCEKLLQKHRPCIEDKELRVIMNGTMEAKADEYLLERALDNLITNAITHSMEKSDVIFSFSSHAMEISNAAELDYDGRLSDLWEPFVMGDKSRSGQGTGLGLAIAANIFDRHKWDYKLRYNQENKQFVCRVKIPFGLLF